MLRQNSRCCFLRQRFASNFFPKIWLRSFPRPRESFSIFRQTKVRQRFFSLNINKIAPLTRHRSVPRQARPAFDLGELACYGRKPGDVVFKEQFLREKRRESQIPNPPTNFNATAFLTCTKGKSGEKLQAHTCCCRADSSLAARLFAVRSEDLRNRSDGQGSC